MSLVLSSEVNQLKTSHMNTVHNSKANTTILIRDDEVSQYFPSDQDLIKMDWQVISGSSSLTVIRSVSVCPYSTEAAP